MFYSPKLFLRDWWILESLVVVALSQVFIWSYLIYYIHPSAEQLFLHYNIVFGVDLVGAWWKIYYLPVGGIVTLLINYLFSIAFYDTDKILARFLGVLSAVIHVFLVIAAVFIVGLNI